MSDGHASAEHPESGATWRQRWLRDAITWRTWLLALAVWTLVSAFLGGAEVAARLLAERPPAPVNASLLVVYVLHTVLWVPVTIAVLQVTRRFPLERGRMLGSALALLVVGVALTTTRIVAYLALGRVIGETLGLARGRTDDVYAVLHYGAQDLSYYGIAVLVIHTLRHARAVREREVTRAQLEGQLAQAQLQALKGQIHPHFLFNTLHAISTLVREDAARAERMIASLSDLLRSTLTHQRTQEVAVREELATLASYVEIEQTRLGERLTVTVDAEPDVRDARLPHLLLQPLVENAIRHGISPRLRPGHVRVGVARSGAWLHLVVADDGRGFVGPPRPGAIGLANCRARLAQLYGAFHRFDLHSVPGEGTRIEITIPFHPASELTPGVYEAWPAGPPRGASAPSAASAF